MVAYAKQFLSFLSHFYFGIILQLLEPQDNSCVYIYINFLLNQNNASYSFIMEIFSIVK